MTEIDLQDTRDYILNAVLEMFDKVFGISIVVSDTEMLEIMHGEHVAVSVHCTGDLLGNLIITMSSAFANLLADRIPETAASEKKNVNALYAGCDYICRRLDDHLKNMGFACDLSSPFVVVGNDFRTVTLSMEKSEIFSFQHKEQRIRIELGLKMLNQRNTGAKGKPVVARIPDSFEESNMRKFLRNAVPTMFERMFSIKNVMSATAPDLADGQLMAGSVCLAGTLTGCVHLFVAEDFAKLMTAAMFDLTPDEIENINEIHTVIGQACMIITRNLKRHLNDVGHMPELSNPQITYGTNFSIDHARMTRHETLAFEQDGNAISVHVGLNIPGDRVVSANDLTKITDEQTIDCGKPVTIDSSPKNLLVSGLQEGGENFILDIPLDVSVELGRTSKKISELLNISEGSIIVLSELENDPVDIIVNGVRVAKGEVVVENGKYGVRITDVKSRSERMKTKISNGNQ